MGYCTDNSLLSQGLAYLTAHSLEEDAYGVVQKDVPRVIEAVLSFTAALEAYAQELEKLTSAAHPVPPEGDADDEMRRYLETRRLKESEAIGEIVGPLLTGALLAASPITPECSLTRC